MAGPAADLGVRSDQNAVAGSEAMLNCARSLTLVGLFASAATLWIYFAGMPTMKLCERTTPSVCQGVIVSAYGSVGSVETLVIPRLPAA
jgi:hypothetical protein